jgi:hypothetical protein
MQAIIGLSFVVSLAAIAGMKEAYGELAAFLIAIPAVILFISAFGLYMKLERQEKRNARCVKCQWGGKFTETVDDDDVPRCPECGSEQVYEPSSMRRSDKKSSRMLVIAFKKGHKHRVLMNFFDGKENLYGHIVRTDDEIKRVLYNQGFENVQINKWKY